MKNIYSIKELREALNVTQRDAAKALNISTYQYRLREKDPRLMSIGQTEKLAELLEVPFHKIWALEQMQIEGFMRGGGKCRSLSRHR